MITNKHIRRISVLIMACTVLCLVMALGGCSSSSSVKPASQEETVDEVANSEPDARPSYAVKPTVNDYSWPELSQISAEIAAAEDEAASIKLAKAYNLCTSDGMLDGAQEKTVILSDGTETAVQIVGFVHDDKTSGGKAGITFIFKDAIARHDMNSDDGTAGGWKDSQMRSWLGMDGIALLPEELEEQIVAVDKLTNNVGYQNPADATLSSVSTTSDELWLFSLVELCGATNLDINATVPAYGEILKAEGSQYKLFQDEHVDKSIASKFPCLVKTLEGNSVRWWERTPAPDVAKQFKYVHSGSTMPGFPSEIHGVVPGFCI